MKRGILALTLSASLAALGQQIGQNTPSGASLVPTLSVSSQLVIETVSVKDKSGNPVNGLTAKDFTLTEDGAPQKIQFCEHQDLPAEGPVIPASLPPVSDLKVYYHLSSTQIAPEPRGSTLYKNRRLLALYFDMTALPPADQVRSLTAAQSFIHAQMEPDDLVAVLRYSGGGIDVLQDFTADRTRLLSILETMIVGEGQAFAEAADDASSSDTGAAFGQDDSEFNIFNTDRQLAALQTAAKMLGELSEKKSLVYFASGLRLNGLDNQAQLHATINDAIRSGVSFWPIDARGLVAEAPLGDATQGSQGNAGMYSGTAALAMMSGFQQSQDTLYTLASDTGGKALLDYNDLTRGIRQAEQSVSSYYILGYYTTNSAQDGKFRRIHITFPSNPDAVLDYRQGYYAGKVFAKFNAADKERQLEDALMLNDPVTELTIAMEIDYFQLNRAEYFVPIIVKIPGRELALARKRGAQHTLIDFIGEIKDDYGGMTVTNLRDKVDIKLSDESAEQLAKRPIEYDTGFTLLPGKYTIKFLARDDETGRIGTYQATFVIPNLNKEVQRLPISSVVLSSQRVDLKNAIYNAEKAKQMQTEQTVNPLVHDGAKLIPSVTRVFTRDQNLFVYLQAYEQGAPQTQPLLAYVTFYRGPKKSFETRPVKLTTGWDNHVKTMPLAFTIPLGGLEPGSYDCQVTVLNPTGGKAAFWQAPVMVLP
ncbi:MAG TPA: VWA domain-containing protein [Acidobacteriaceae bacterium]|jgi:VWFA-related protein|nr:VWA domain-containing protein [Acidobacteriaceae bacterium]